MIVSICILYLSSFVIRSFSLSRVIYVIIAPFSVLVLRSNAYLRMKSCSVFRSSGPDQTDYVCMQMNMLGKGQ